MPKADQIICSIHFGHVKLVALLVFFIASICCSYLAAKLHAPSTDPISANPLELPSSLKSPSLKPLVPPISPDMKKALDNVGLSLSEGYYWHATHHPINTTFMTLFPGLSRLCYNAEYMKHTLKRCVRGLTTMVFTLQSQKTPAGIRGIQAEDSFDVCVEHIKRFSQTPESKCNILVAKQAFLRKEEPFNCEDNKRANKAKVRMQTFAVGRVYDWAKFFFPQHDYYVRARLDGMWCLPGNLPKERFIGLNHIKMLYDGNDNTFFPSDRYGLVPKELTEVYFEAWKSWLVMDCNDWCLSGTGNRTANRMGWFSGECPLSAHMNAYWDQFSWKSVDGVGNALVRAVNATHVHYSGDKRLLTYEKAIQEQRVRELNCQVTDKLIRRDMRIPSHRKR